MTRNKGNRPPGSKEFSVTPVPDWDADREFARLLADEKAIAGEMAERDLYGAADEHWLAGSPMDPAATRAEPMPTLPGFPYLHAGVAAIIVGPTGGGRSSLMEAGLYDAAKAGLRAAYLGNEVTPPEFDARAALLAELRGDTIDNQLRRSLARVRYLNLASAISTAWERPNEWVEQVCARYEIVIVDPLSTVASVLDLDFDRSNSDFVKFYDRLISPLTTRNVTVVNVDNVGHATDARKRAKGASAKSDRADLTFYCRGARNPAGLRITADKVRTIRAAFKQGDEWLFTRDDQQIIAASAGEAVPVVFEKAKMAAICAFVGDNPDVSTSKIYLAVDGRQDNIRAHLEELIHRGYIKRDRQPGRGALQPKTTHRLLKPWGQG